MFYLYLSIIILAVFVLSFILTKNITLKDCGQRVHLNKLNNKDMPCSEAFEELRLSNTWGEIIK